jgi:AbrB family transcriptional regulator, stage V sporulation protein T
LKATGIIRKIDELGRVVIPKEIRRNFKIREREPLEFFVDSNGEVILKKYSPIGELGNFVRAYADSLHQVMGHVACITDRDKIIAASGASEKEFVNRPFSAAVEQVIQTRKSLLIHDTGQHEFYKNESEENASKFAAEVIAPIISDGEVIGAVIMGTKDRDVKLGDLELKLVETAAGFLSRQMG